MIALALLVAAIQHDGHTMPGMTTPMPAAKPKVRPTKPADDPITVSAPPAVAPSAYPCPPEHAAMGHCSPDASPAGPAAPSGTDLPAGNAPPPPAPRVGYADRGMGGAMAASRAQLYREHGGGRFAQVMVDLAEVSIRDGRDRYRWDGEGWFGGDRDRLVVKSEGHGFVGRGAAEVEVQALYARVIGPYFNFQTGVRHDFGAGPARTHLALGVEGLAPYWFEVAATAFVSDRGGVSARLEAYYDQRLTQRLILQPRLEANLSAQDDRARGIGSGVSELELGLRLRYERVREFAPYVGVAWDRKLGESARFAGAGGHDASDLSFVAGIRVWF